MSKSIIIFVAIAVMVIFIATIYVIDFIKNKSREEKIVAVKEWLLFCVTKMENIYGSGTGQMKLRAAWDFALQRFPFLAMIVTFDEFSKWIDEALEQMKEMLKNDKIESFVTSEIVP